MRHPAVSFFDAAVVAYIKADKKALATKIESNEIEFKKLEIRANIMLRNQLEEEMLDIALLQPTAAEEDHFGPLEHYQLRLNTSSAYIQHMLGNIRSFENKKRQIC